MSMGGGSGSGPMGDINVTPLVDVMLVLVIIFMVTAPMMNAGVDIDLPQVNAPPISQDSDQQLVLAIDAELNYYIGDNMFTGEEMPAKLAAIVLANPDQPVFLRADGAVPY